MTIKDMHYDFKMKLNKIDSQQYKNLIIPQIDWILNEACEIFVKIIAEPRLKNHFGVEVNQRTIEDIRPLIEENISCSVGGITDNSGTITLPDNYWYYLKGKFILSKGSCTNIKAKASIKQHDDRFERSPFNRSSFEWREVNGVFYKDGIRFFTDGSFQVTDFKISYIRKLVYMHNAEDFGVGTYELPNGTPLGGTVDCELLEHTHKEIVDIAVLLATGQLNIPDYQLKLNKLRINNLK